MGAYDDLSPKELARIRRFVEGADIDTTLESDELRDLVDSTGLGCFRILNHKRFIKRALAEADASDPLLHNPPKLARLGDCSLKGVLILWRRADAKRRWRTPYRDPPKNVELALRRPSQADLLKLDQSPSLPR